MTEKNAGVQPEAAIMAQTAYTGEQPQAEVFAASQSEWSTQHLAKLVFLSYRFSQGGVGIQTRLLLHIEDTHYPGMFDEPIVSDIKSRTRRLVSSFFMNAVVHPPVPYSWEEMLQEDTERSIRNAEDDVEGVFERLANRTSDDEYSHDIASITEAIVTMDLNYLQRKNGRADVNNIEASDTDTYPKDPFESQFINHAILGHPTRAPEYDLLFADVGDPANIAKLDEHTRDEIRQLASIFCQKHPAAIHEPSIRTLMYLLYS